MGTWRLQNILSAKDRTTQKSNKDTDNLSDAVEHKTSLKNQGNWNDFSHEKYQELFWADRGFDSK